MRLTSILAVSAAILPYVTAPAYGYGNPSGVYVDTWLATWTHP